ncbi:hypothetical protein BHE18_03175 [Rossellomorea aquimaris]|jgi:hypothetical protein|uniref:Uncharacterized protein n=1 Tax=Rossellomorea aquimaris TaxID=189382 RepID=A0A1J6W274_9BACI|nr:hypothetical protein BHE18_03175 [Rossellomorea aquimaris]
MPVEGEESGSFTSFFSRRFFDKFVDKQKKGNVFLKSCTQIQIVGRIFWKWNVNEESGMYFLFKQAVLAYTR